MTRRHNLWTTASISFFAIASVLNAASVQAVEVIKLWPGGRAPGDTMQLEAEADSSEAGKGLVAGKPIIRLKNVSEPELHFYPATGERASGACVVVCPGGGHQILAWDLEGTEVAQWLNELGVSAVVLKYRVPARTKDPRHTAAVQDAQRAMSIVRSRAKQWQIDPNKIGIMGFSAGGETAALASLFTKRLYDPVDKVDETSSRPNFSILIYPAYLVSKDASQLEPHVQVDDQTPPMFFVHAADDSVRPESSVRLWLELNKRKIPSELHVFSRGGHGYGLRATDMPVTSWPVACAAWLKKEKWAK